MPDKAPSDNQPREPWCEQQCSAFPRCTCGHAEAMARPAPWDPGAKRAQDPETGVFPCEPHSVAGSREFRLTKIANLPHVEVEGELRPITRAGLPKFDALGLFVQWLAEAVSTLGLHFEISVGVGPKGTDARWPGGADVRLRIEEGTMYHSKTWDVDLLNEKMSDAGGRGDPLRVEIADAMNAIKAKLKEGESP